MLEFLIAIPVIGQLLLCVLIVIPIGAPLMVWQGFVMLFDDDIFVGLFAIVLGVAACIFTWPLVWEVIKMLCS